MATPYSFTQPIRYYKANDPYYYEVDNIPLRQLEENILYIKGLVEGAGSGAGAGGGFLTENSEIDITNIKQLKPKATGGRSVQVNAGTFVSRINDAFDISKPLNQLIISQTPGSTQIGIPSIEQQWSAEQRNQVWNDFTGSPAASKAYNVNGLENTYTFYSTPGTMGNSWGVVTGDQFAGNYPHYGGVEPTEAVQWPGSSYAGHLSPTLWGVGYSEAALPTVHLAFVQMWRGVFRTAVVDFPQSSIEIPAWNDNDFSYTNNQTGEVVILDANQRIDLLVAYSLPIDSQSTTLPNFETAFCNGSVPMAQTITTPTLGIVRGAGIGMRKNEASNPRSIESMDGCDDAGEAGSRRITANRNDSETGANVGIKGPDGRVVHGSFPSPDDLLNIAPVVALGVGNDAWQLIGQAALPLAYVVVTKGQATITANDIIDIRPFLRTTEFTYNERAGIAAANPPLSFANPAVGAFQLQTAIDATIAADSGSGSGGESTNNGRAIYTDYVMGGLAYGVEGTMLTMCDGPQEAQDPFGNQSQTAAYTDPYNGSSLSFGDFTSAKDFLDNTDTYLREAFLQYIYNNRQTDLKRWLSDPNSSFSQNPYTYLGLPEGTTGRNIPLFPEWDMPMDGTNYLNLMGQGTQGSTAGIPKVTWWMWFEGVMQDSRPLAYVPGGVPSLVPSYGSLAHLSKDYDWGFGDEHGSGFINVVTKKLEVTFPSWVNDYDVLVEYVNCGPVTSANRLNHSDLLAVGLGSGLSINKGPVVSSGGIQKAVFQINSSAQAQPANMLKSTDGSILDKTAGHSQSEIEATNRSFQWLSYAVALPQFKSPRGTDAQGAVTNDTMRFTPKFGASYYPSIKFTIIGYTGSPINQNEGYTPTNDYTLIQDVQAGNSSVITGILGPVTGTSKIIIPSA